MIRATTRVAPTITIIIPKYNTMKLFKFLVFCLMAVLMNSIGFAQDVTPGAKGNITCSGSYRFPSAGNTASLAADTLMRPRARNKGPLYTAYDTVLYNASDTFSLNLGSGTYTPNQVPNFQCNNLVFTYSVDSIAGGVDSMTIVLEAAILQKPGEAMRWSTIQTFTVTAATKNFWYRFDGTGGWCRYRSRFVVADRGVLAKARWWGTVWYD